MAAAGRRLPRWCELGRAFVGEKGEGDDGILFPHSPRTGVQWSVLATGAGGGGRSCSGAAALGGRGGELEVVDRLWSSEAR